MNNNMKAMNIIRKSLNKGFVYTLQFVNLTNFYIEKDKIVINY